jgi:NitT/TauT family transport system ATP-binding protein
MEGVPFFAEAVMELAYQKPTITRTGQELCEAWGVWYEYAMPGGKARTVLQDVDLTVLPHEIVAIIGPTGCGKSTLLRILAGLTKPARGKVVYKGQPMDGINPAMAFVFQSFALLPWQTTFENIYNVLRAAGHSRADSRARTGHVIHAVGLDGFAALYPREMSGGMRQRVGIARALAIDPEILMMDEPFSQVDALTAEGLRSEVLKLWSNRKGKLSSIVFVSHDIHEVVELADRIVVLSANPCRVRTVVDNRLPRPREPRCRPVTALVDYLHEIVTFTDRKETRKDTDEFEPLPETVHGEVLGLLEYLDAHGGQEDLIRIATDTHRPSSQVLPVANAAELLDLVETPRRLIVLTSEGRHLVRAGPIERQALWREKLMRLRLFREAQAIVTRAGARGVGRAAMLEMLAQHLPDEDCQKQFNILVHWARYGELFRYNERTQSVSLPSDR